MTPKLRYFQAGVVSNNDDADWLVMDAEGRSWSMHRTEEEATEAAIALEIPATIESIQAELDRLKDLVKFTLNR